MPTGGGQFWRNVDHRRVESTSEASSFSARIYRDVMTREDAPKVPALDLDPSTATRREALSASLKARRTPVPPRAYSTLVQRPEGDQDGQLVCAYCDSLKRAAESHLLAHQHMRDFPRSYDELLATVLDFPSRAVRAGGTESSGDDVEDQGDGDPRAAAGDECHDGGAEHQD